MRTASSQWRNGGGCVGCDCTSLVKKSCPLQINMKLGLFFFFLRHFNFCLTAEKRFYVFILFPALEECYYAFILLKIFIKTAKRTHLNIKIYQTRCKSRYSGFVIYMYVERSFLNSYMQFRIFYYLQSERKTISNVE